MCLATVDRQQHTSWGNNSGKILNKQLKAVHGPVRGYTIPKSHRHQRNLHSGSQENMEVV